jgi:hypothetical protein
VVQKRHERLAQPHVRQLHEALEVRLKLSLPLVDDLARHGADELLARQRDGLDARHE